MTHELTRAEARRIAVRAQLLTSTRPTDLVETVRHLTLLQNDPTSVIAPNADLVAWTRLGSSYAVGDVEDALANGELVELQGLVRVAEDIALFRADMDRWRDPEQLTGWQRATAEWVEANDGCRRDILQLLHEDGPLPSKALPDTTVVSWKSSGWNNDRNVRMLVELLERRGEVACAGRDGRDRLWDLAERVYPDTDTVPLDEAARALNQRRLTALGIARAKATATPIDANDVGEVGEAARIDGVRGTWRIDPAYLEGDVEPRVALLSPLDRLVYDRKRMADVFEFDYQLEMYKPAAQRRWGYWALPVLAGDELVGKVDATADLKQGSLYVDAVHEDFDWPASLRESVDEELDAMATWLGVEVRRA